MALLTVLTILEKPDMTLFTVRPLGKGKYLFNFHSVKRCSLDVCCSPCCTYYILHGRSFPGDGGAGGGGQTNSYL